VQVCIDCNTWKLCSFSQTLVSPLCRFQARPWQSQVRATAMQMVHQGAAVPHLEHHGFAILGNVGDDLAGIQADILGIGGRGQGEQRPKRSQTFS